MDINSAVLPTLALAALTACATPPVAVAVAGRQTITPGDRIAAECRLLARAETQFAAHDGLREGCPGVTVRDARPLAQQVASLREATAAELPARVVAGSHGEDAFRRMITRGVPVPVAVALVMDTEFDIFAQH